MGAVATVTVAVSVTSVIAVVALGISVLSVVATWATARANMKAASAAEISAKATENAVKLEVQRRHDELTPHFRLNHEPSPGTDFLRLTVLLTGPVQLERLDGLTLTVRDDTPWRGEPTPVSEANGITPEQLAEQVWGPYRLRPGISTGTQTPRSAPADPSGREIRTSGMRVGESLPFVLEPTLPPPWSEQHPQQWRDQQEPTLRLQLRCEKDGWQQWTLPCQIELRSSRREVEV